LRGDGVLRVSSSSRCHVSCVDASFLFPLHAPSLVDTAPAALEILEDIGIALTQEQSQPPVNKQK
jgi:hypothetical protein